MKYLITLFLFAAVVSTNAQTVDDAIDWNDDIVLTQSLMLSFEDILIESIANDEPADSIATAYIDYVTFIDVAIEVYEAEEAFDSQDIFRKALLELLYVFKAVAENEYVELIDIYLTPVEELTDVDFERWDDLIAIIDEKEIAANDAFLDAQEKFADQYGFSLGD